MKALLQTGSSGRVPVPREKRFLINLHSLLPICCSCKRIRDDNGYWQRLEEFIEGHYTGIDFTHGLCPECTKKLYPQISAEKAKTPAPVHA